MKNHRVLFVCLGNICRSPTAHAVFRHMVERENLQQFVTVDSAGTGDWHVGRGPDRRAAKVAKTRGYRMDDLIARQVRQGDFDDFDFVLAMDAENLFNLEQVQPRHFNGHLGLFLEFSSQNSIREVPDPYYGGDQGFTQVIELIEDASQGLLQHLKNL